jgi:acetylornithine/N-succinyldiaminopimelate aminotransferase
MDSSQLLAAARAHLFPNYAPPPLVMVRGEGPHLFDAEGRRYIDFAAGLSVLALGHAHPALADAIAAQAHRLGHLSNVFSNDQTTRLALRLVGLGFGDRVFFCNSGAEANEAAIKLARRHFFVRGEPRTEVVAAQHSFHGRTLGALSATGQPRYHEGFGPLVPGFHHVPYGDVEALRRQVSSRTALVMLEPILGEGGVVLPPPGYLAEARRVCDGAGALLHFDEVQVGMGRTGRWFCHQHEAVTPDTLSLAKALGGGLPLGALLARDELAQALTPGTHASTFGGNPIACAAGLAYIDHVEANGLLARAGEVGERVLSRLRAAAPSLPRVREVRGRGCFVGVELDVPAAAYGTALRERGLLVAVVSENVVRLAPPLNVPWEVLDEALTILLQVLSGPG